MSIEMVPADLNLIHNPRNLRSLNEIQRGETVSFRYTGGVDANKVRTVLVLENDGQHLKGVCKERDYEYRNHHYASIYDAKIVVPFLDKKEVVTYNFVKRPDPVNTMKCVDTKSNHQMKFKITNKQGNMCYIYGYNNEGFGLNCPSQNINSASLNVEKFFDTINKFLAE